MAIPAAYPAFVRIGGCGADRPAQCVGAAFSDVACTSAYDMAAALKVVEECQSFVSAEFVAYVKRAMHLYRLKIKAGTIELKDEHYAFYHNFRVAKSWAEVVTAFNGVTSPAAVNSGHRGGDHRRMMDMMMEIFPPSNEEERAVRDAARKILRQEREAKEKRQRANASDAQVRLIPRPPEASSRPFTLITIPSPSSCGPKPTYLTMWRKSFPRLSASSITRTCIIRCTPNKSLRARSKRATPLTSLATPLSFSLLASPATPSRACLTASSTGTRRPQRLWHHCHQRPSPFLLALYFPCLFADLSPMV